MNRERQQDLDERGIAKTAREEKKKRARDAKLSEAENARMARLCRQHILKVEAGPELRAAFRHCHGAQEADAREEVGSFGD